MLAPLLGRRTFRTTETAQQLLSSSEEDLDLQMISWSEVQEFDFTYQKKESEMFCDKQMIHSSLVSENKLGVKVD